MMENQYH